MDRKLEKSVELDASPEQVWEAVATGPGITAWFVPTEVEPGEGAAITQRFGGGADVTGAVLASEPGARFVYGAAVEPEQGPNYAFEFLVEARDGGGTVLRLVQSGFLDGTDWDGEYDGFDTGWTLFLHNLATYLEHFGGQRARGVVSMAFAPGSAADAWPVLHRALGLAGHPRVGDAVTLTGPEPITGVVDVASPAFLGVRSAHGLHRIGAEGDAGCGVSAYHYHYGVEIDADAASAAWQSWLTDLFPPPPGSGGPSDSGTQ